MRSLIVALVSFLLALAPLPAAAQTTNTLTLRGAPSGSAPALAATGKDLNINLDLAPKGAGIVTIHGVPIPLSGGLTCTGCTPGTLPVATGVGALGDSFINQDLANGVLQAVITSPSASINWQVITGGGSAVLSLDPTSGNNGDLLLANDLTIGRIDYGAYFQFGGGTAEVRRLQLQDSSAPVDAVAASATITDGGITNVTLGTTVTVNGTAIYTFVAALASNGDVIQGLTADISTQNLADAINGTCIAQCQVAGANADVTSGAVGAGAITLTAIVFGAAGNTLTLTSNEPSYTLVDFATSATGVNGTPCTQNELRGVSGGLWYCTVTALVSTPPPTWKQITIP